MWFTNSRDPSPNDDAYIAAFYKELDAAEGQNQDGRIGDRPTAVASITEGLADAAQSIRAFIELQQQQWIDSPYHTSSTDGVVSPSSIGSTPPIRLAIVTSGSVPTPLDTGMVNYLDTLGSGNRAAACAEAFLKAGYHVLFLYREGSLRPYSRVLAKRMKKAQTLTEQVRLNAEGHLEMVLDPTEEICMTEMIARYEAVKSRLLEVTFSDLFGYLYLLREACLAASPLGPSALLFLAAGLTKMFIPRHELRKPSSAFLDQGKEALKLSPVPHVIRAARQSWCPLAFLVAFKLENDTLTLVEGAHRLLERHGLHLVVGNTVNDRNRRVLIVTARDETRLVSPKEKELEPGMVKAVIRAHRHFTLEREALKSSRSLLGLSAKFTMLRENKSLVDEDAYGNKQVPFKVGLHIKGDRRAQHSPIYELKAVYTNKEASARANLWQRVVDEEGLRGEGKAGADGELVGCRDDASKGPGSNVSSSPALSVEGSPSEEAKRGRRKELLLTFSPAGNPETILNLWGDTYKGWLEDEVKRIVTAAKHIPLSTYLKILAAPVTADFTDLADLLCRLRESIAQAWEKRERTQFIQSYNNLMSLAFDRGLTPVEGLMDAHDLLGRRRALEEQERIRGYSTPRSSSSGAKTFRASCRLSSTDSDYDHGGRGNRRRRMGGEGGVKIVKLHKPVFRGLSIGSMLHQQHQTFFSWRRNSRKSSGFDEQGRQERGSRLSLSRNGLPVADADREEEELVGKAGTVRVHATVKRFAEDMLSEGLLDDVLQCLEAAPDCRLVITGYSLGGMLSQLFCLYLGEALVQRGMSTQQVLMMGFGSPRVGDDGFKARLRLLYPQQSALMNAVYPLDTLHAFPPASEGYADAVVKVFLRQPGQFVGRRTPSRSTPFATPLSWLRVFDTKVDEIASKHRQEVRARGATGETLVGSRGSEDECVLCASNAHTTLRHRCRICTERGSHRSADCPNRGKGCKLCGLPDHPTGQHLCSVCKLPGHRGRYCHELQSVGWAELAAFALFHDASYYSLATAAEDPVSLRRMAPVPTTPPRPPRSHAGATKALGVTFREDDLKQLETTKDA